MFREEFLSGTGTLCWQEAGLCLAAVFERYGKNGNVSWGFVEHALSGERGRGDYVVA